MSTAEVETKLTIVERLKSLISIIESMQLNMSYVVVSALSNEVAISEDDFKRVFNGQTFVGVRRGAFIDVKSEFGGVVFTATIYKPTEHYGEEEVSIPSLPPVASV